MSNSSKRGSLAGQGTPPLPALLACAFLACGLVLFVMVAFHIVKTTPLTGTGGSSTNSTAVAEQAAATAAAAVEMQAMMQLMREQLHQLQASLPETIQKELQQHHKATQQQQQQQQQQLPPQQQPQQPPQQQTPPQQPQGVWLPDHKVHHIGQARAACDKRSAAGIKLGLSDRLVAPVVVVAHNRVHYLAKCLMTLLKYWSEDPANAERFPLFVSVDGGDQATMQFAAALHYGAQVQVIHNLRDATRCKPKDGYCNLAVHYHMLVQLFFECLKAPRLIFMEEDLEISPDFFSYFAAFAPLLHKDPGLMCVSAWNDHGQRGRALNSSAVHRTDIFPGLGWMLTAEVGLELHKGWPDSLWDEYMREPRVRKGRQCIFPEVPRTHTFGKVGTSGGQFFDQHLAVMLLNKEPVDWSKQDLTQYESGPYAQLMAGWLEAAQPLDPSGLDLPAFCSVNQPDHEERGDLLLHYRDGNEFKAIASKLHPMLIDTKGGPVADGVPLVPRASYKGVVMVRCRGRRLFIAPEPGSPAEPAEWPPGSSGPRPKGSSSDSSSSSDREGPGATARHA